MRACREPFGLRPDTPAFSDRGLAIYREATTLASGQLRDAILRAKGYHVPEPVVPAMPVFWPRHAKRGPPMGSRNALKVRRPNAKIAQIQALIANYFGITIDDMLSKRRGYRISHPRQIAMYLARKTTTVSYPDIALQFGGKDHTTVLYSVHIIEGRIAENDADTINAIRAAHAVIGR